MAIDIKQISYSVYLLRETGEQLDLTTITESPTWEESDGELATRISLTLANIEYNGSRISSLAKPNCYIIIKASTGNGEEETARGKIVEWTPRRTATEDTLELTCYDELYDLQASQDNRYLSEGVSTKTALTAIFDDWGIPLGTYAGPTVAHAKTVFKNEYLSDIILELLDTAHKHGAADCTIRAEKGKVNVLPKCSNDTVYVFEEDVNLETSEYKITTSDMVTVVKVVATADDDERQAVEAVVNGMTEYGKRQRIYVRDDDDTLATATAAAQEILDEEGKPEETITVKSPDVPTVRKYDKVYIKSRVYTGYAMVVSVTHNADDKAMSMDLEKYDG